MKIVGDRYEVKEVHIEFRDVVLTVSVAILSIVIQYLPF